MSAFTLFGEPLAVVEKVLFLDSCTNAGGGLTDEISIRIENITGYQMQRPKSNLKKYRDV